LILWQNHRFKLALGPLLPAHPVTGPRVVHADHVVLLFGSVSSYHLVELVGIRTPAQQREVELFFVRATVVPSGRFEVPPLPVHDQRTALEPHQMPARGRDNLMVSL